MGVNVSRIARRGLAAAAAASLAALTGMGVGLSQPAPPNEALPQLGACMAERGALDVVILMDETGSLVGEFNEATGSIDTSVPGTDDDHNRIPAAQSFVDELVARQADTGADVRVRVAGFGQEYHSGATDPANYGPWQELNESSADKVKGEIAQFQDRWEEVYTNYANALEGAYNDFARSGSENPCRLLVTFTDGELTAQEGEDAARERICRAGGIADRLRAGGITNVGIGLSSPDKPADFGLMRGITDGSGGEPCGQPPFNGAFFEASNVGGLFAAFQRALSSGRDAVHEGPAAQPFEFTLDQSIDAVRFNAIAEENLGQGAHLVLTAPDGSTVDLAQSGRGEAAGAAVEWTTATEPTQRVSGRMRLSPGADWSGTWKLGFVDFDPEQAEGRVISQVEIQPDLQVRFRSDEVSEGPLSLFDDQTIHAELINGSGDVHPLAGEAKTTIVFEADGREPVVLVENADIAGGSIEIPASKIEGAPVSGRLEARTVVSTSGEPKTTFSPFINQQAVTVSPQNLPQVAGPVQFASESVTGQGEIAVKGPGKVWIEPGTQIRANALPDGVDAVNVASQYDSEDNALEVAAGEMATLPVTFTVAEPTEGIINGNVDVSVADLNGEVDAAHVPVSVNGSYTVPLNTAKFTGALIGALLAALLIPLLVFYLIRFVTSRIPTRRQLGSQLFPIELEGTNAQFVNGRPELSSQEALMNPAQLTSTTFSASGYNGKVRGFHPNPFADAPVLVEQVPSISSDGEQVKGAAKLPLALPNTWFVAASNRGPNSYDVVALLNPGTPEAQLKQMATEISTNAPQLVRELHDLRAAGADPFDDLGGGNGGDSSGGPGGPTNPGGPTPPPPPPGFGQGAQPGPQTGPTPGGFGSGGFGSGPGPQTPPPPPPSQGGFGSN
ncbi:vWA domain-containing protein [Corynebacterium riegelii]